MRELKELRRSTQASLCLECGKCSTLCPLAPLAGFSAARMVAIHEPREEIQRQALAVERCLTCASCEVRCPQGVRFTDFVQGLRAYLPREARQPCPHGEMLQAAARLTAGEEAPQRDLSWLGDDLKISEEGEIGLFVGCLPFFDVLFRRQLPVRMLEIARSAVRVLNHLGIEPVVVAEERCCGHDLLWSGDGEAFTALAEANARAFSQRGVRHLLTTCAECCRTWRQDIPRASGGYQPKVQHLAEFLAQRAAGGEIVFRENGTATVTYQDPCRLGRHLGVTDAPRQVLAAMPGTELREMQHTGLDALCCGTAGFMHCDATSRQLQAHRLADAADTGAEKLLTACPKCLLHFACAQAEDQRRQRPSPPIEVEDLTIFAAAHLAAPENRATGEPS